MKGVVLGLGLAALVAAVLSLVLLGVESPEETLKAIRCAEKARVAAEEENGFVVVDCP